MNDPSTAITCIDQLSRILIRWVSRYGPEILLSDPPHVVRVVMPSIEVDGLLDTVFEQIRHYAVTDIAVSARLLRALDDVASSTGDATLHERLFVRARRVYEGCRDRLAGDDLDILRQRLGSLQGRLAGGDVASLAERQSEAPEQPKGLATRDGRSS